MSEECVLAIEAGGTKCEALLMSIDGTALGFHAVYPNAVAGTGGYGRGREANTATHAVEGALRVCNPEGTLHLACSSYLLTGEIRNLARARRVLLWNAGEAESALAWGGVDDGLVALAGTGAFGYLRLNGSYWVADGVGPLLGDRGGSYQIGREGLRAVFRPGSTSAVLREELIRLEGLSPEEDLEKAMVPLSVRIMGDRTAVAHYAIIVNRAARRGDPDAIAILEQAADDLSGTIRYLVDKLDVGGRALPMVGTGGMIRHSDIYWNRLVQRVAGFLPHVRALRQDLPQVAGRALAGLGHAIRNGACHADAAASRERLLATLPPLLEKIKPLQETPPLPRTA